MAYEASSKPIKERAMPTETILKQSATLPEFLQKVFKCVDSKDFEGVKSFVSPDFRLFFAHYILHGINQGIGFVGAFDKRLPKYQHVMGDIYVGDHITIFDGVLRVWLDDGSVLETPFWDKIEVDPATGKITTMYALFSIAAVPEKYWKDLKPEDFA
jgi:hypothetical protein